MSECPHPTADSPLGDEAQRRVTVRSVPSRTGSAEALAQALLERFTRQLAADEDEAEKTVTGRRGSFMG
jgi:hypothetical protein